MDRRGAERDNKRRKKKQRNRKPWELDSEGEETSDGSSSEKVTFLLLRKCLDLLYYYINVVTSITDFL